MTYRIRSNDSDIAGHFYSQKLARTVQYESGLELNIMTRLERSDQVSFYQEQPVVIPYSFKDKLRKYYPDLLVTFNYLTTMLVMHTRRWE